MPRHESSASNLSFRIDTSIRDASHITVPLTHGDHPLPTTLPNEEY
jgi:hypothetical protein